MASNSAIRNEIWAERFESDAILLPYFTVLHESQGIHQRNALLLSAGRL